MNKSRKIFLSVVVVIFLLVVISLIVVAVNLDRIVKKGVETVGPQILKAPVTLNEVHIGPVTGSAKVKGLLVGNPEGYKTPYAMTVDLAEVGINPMSVLADKIVIRAIHVKSPEITFEGNPLGKNNLGDLMANVNAMSKNGAPSPGSTNKAGATRKIEVDDFLITGAIVHVNLTVMGGKNLTLPLPDIHLANLGRGSDGLTPAELTRAVLSSITSATIKTVASAATDVGKNVETLGKNLGKDAVKTMGTNLNNKISKGLNGLLGK